MGIFTNDYLLEVLAVLAYEVDCIAIEKPSYIMAGIHPKPMINTLIWTGRFEQRIRENVDTIRHPSFALDIRYYGRSAIKGQIGGRKDAEVNKNLRLRYGEAKKGKPLYGVKSHIWAALAIACAISENRNLNQW